MRRFIEEDRRKDKIVAAAREKIALQLERKKKLAEFLRLKTVPTDSISVDLEDSTKEESVEEERVKKDSAKKRKRSRSKREGEKPEDIVVAEVYKIDDSDSEEGEIRKHKKSSKKKKSHKRWANQFGRLAG